MLWRIVALLILVCASVAVAVPAGCRYGGGCDGSGLMDAIGYPTTITPPVSAPAAYRTIV